LNVFSFCQEKNGGCWQFASFIISDQKKLVFYFEKG